MNNYYKLKPKSCYRCLHFQVCKTDDMDDSIANTCEHYEDTEHSEAYSLGYAHGSNEIIGKYMMKSVEDELPDINEYVLVYASDRAFYTARLNEDKQWCLWASAWPGDILYWMPLNNILIPESVRKGRYISYV